jgi:hypothetical protein
MLAAQLIPHKLLQMLSLTAATAATSAAAACSYALLPAVDDDDAVLTHRREWPQQHSLGPGGTQQRPRAG